MIPLRKLALLSMLSASAVAGRLLIHGVNIQPATFIIILTGLFFGWKMGLANGVLVALVSDLVLGMGYWTVFQMLAWGLIGLISGYIPDKPLLYMPWLFLSGFVFGGVMALSYIPFSSNMTTFVSMYLAGLPWDISHGVGNMMFGLVSPILFPLLRKEKDKL